MKSSFSSKYWKEFYKTFEEKDRSPFAEFCLPYLGSPFIDLGCGNGRDLYFFLSKGLHGLGVDSAYEDVLILREKIERFIKQNPPYKYIYTRFLWHAIPRELQLDILDWVSDWIFIEARTTKDVGRFKEFKNHKRYYIDTKQLVGDLVGRGFTIIKQEEGINLSSYGKENPHLIRIIARKT